MTIEEILKNLESNKDFYNNEKLEKFNRFDRDD
jgi:hypothetical protein